MTTDYDPYSDEAMTDPTEIYKELRAEGCPHYIEKYDAWALTRFDDVKKVSMNEKAIDYTHGQLPGQVLLGDFFPHTFLTMNAPDHRKWRALIADDYAPENVEADLPRVRELIKEILKPLLEKGEFDVYRDYGNRVMCRNSGYKLGLPMDKAEEYRDQIDEVLHREKGQVGGNSERNQAAVGKLVELISESVADFRANPDKAVRHTKAFMEAEIDGKKLNDEELLMYILTFLIVGSETTPMSLASCLYNLAKNPEMKAEVMADPSLIEKAFLEAVRYDQPTNMLARKCMKDINVGGQDIKAGQNMLFVYASANRDDKHFENPDKFDIHRTETRTMSFGMGGHFCLGLHLGINAGVIMIEELFKAISDYEVIEDGCERAYGEHLNGFLKMPIRVTLK